MLVREVLHNVVVRDDTTDCHISITCEQEVQTTKMFLVVIINKSKSKTERTSAYIKLDTVTYVWNLMSDKQKAKTNFRFENGEVVCDKDTVNLIPRSEHTLEEYVDTNEDSEQSIWQALIFLKNVGAKVAISDNCTVGIENCKFSFSTPSIVIGGFTSNGYTTRTLWSYEPEMAEDNISMLVPTNILSLPETVTFLPYIEDIVMNEDTGEYSFKFLMSKLSGAFNSLLYTEVSRVEVTFSISYLLYSIGQYELFSCALDGVNCAYKYMRYKQGVTFPKQQQQGYSAKKIYSQNINIMRKLNKPNLNSINKMLYDEHSSYWRDKLDSATPAELDKILELFKIDNNTVYSKMFMMGFNLIYDKSGFIKDAEYVKYCSQIKSIIFTHGMSMFQTKIAMMLCDITAHINKPFRIADGTVAFEKQSRLF